MPLLPSRSPDRDYIIATYELLMGMTDRVARMEQWQVDHLKVHEVLAAPPSPLKVGLLSATMSGIASLAIKMIPFH